MHAGSLEALRVTRPEAVDLLCIKLIERPFQSPHPVRFLECIRRGVQFIPDRRRDPLGKTSAATFASFGDTSGAVFPPSVVTAHAASTSCEETSDLGFRASPFLSRVPKRGPRSSLRMSLAPPEIIEDSLPGVLKIRSEWLERLEAAPITRRFPEGGHRYHSWKKQQRRRPLNKAINRSALR